MEAWLWAFFDGEYRWLRKVFGHIFALNKSGVYFKDSTNKVITKHTFITMTLLGYVIAKTFQKFLKEKKSYLQMPLFFIFLYIMQWNSSNRWYVKSPNIFQVLCIKEIANA